MESYIFFPYSWYLDENETELTVIRVYGLDENNDSICVRITNFTPYIYLELPETINWNSSKAQLFGDELDRILKDKRPLEKKLMFKKKLYGANIDSNGQKKLFPFLMCSFACRGDIRTLEYALKRRLTIPGLGNLQIKMHEQDADPILQLVSCRDIPTAGWISFSGRRIEGDIKDTLCTHEFDVKWKSLRKVVRDTLPNPKIMGFDIEVNSTNPSAMPKPEKPGDKVFQISCVISVQGTDEYRNYLLTLGEPDPDVVGRDTNIYMYPTEARLLLGFTELIREENPNIIVGYNILNFDIPYMIERAKFCDMIREFDTQGFHKYNHAKERTIKWSSSAYKNQEFSFLDAEGRLYVDLLPLVKRDYKMDNYKLKTISEYFIGQTKDPLSVKGIFKCYRIGIKRDENGVYSPKAKKALGIVGKYCVQDSVLVVKLMEKLQTWVGLSEMARTCNVPIFTLYTQGQQIKVYSQIYKYCMYENIVVEKDGYITKDDERYVGAHVFPPVPGVYDNVCPFDFNSLYPSVIIAYNIDYSTIVLDNSVPDNMCHDMEWEDHIGCVHDEKMIRKNALSELINIQNAKIKSVREKAGKSLDKFRKKELADEIELLKKEIQPYMKERSEIYKTKPKNPMCAKRHYRFLKEPKGVLPTILKNLLEARANTREKIKGNKQLMKNNENEEEKIDLESLNVVLDKRQLAYKVSANSMYGAMGVRRGYLPFMPGAMCTTYMGRVSIERVARIIPEQYNGELVYGDTDSNYIHFPDMTSTRECWAFAEKVADEVSALFPAPMRLEFESTIYSRFMILTKKRYMYRSCGKEGVVDNKIGKKGVLLARRDNSQVIRSIYEGLIANIFNGMEKNDVLYYLIQEFNKLCSKSFEKTDFVITKSIGSSTFDIDDIQTVINEKGIKKVKLGDYTVPYLPTEGEEREHLLKLKNAETDEEYYVKCLPAQIQLAEKMRRRGHRVDVGSRIEYVITVQESAKAKQYEKIESYDYYNLHSEIIELDFMHYLKLASNPVDEVLEAVFKIPNFVLNQYNFRLKTRTNMLSELRRLFEPKLIFYK